MGRNELSDSSNNALGPGSIEEPNDVDASQLEDSCATKVSGTGTDHSLNGNSVVRTTGAMDRCVRGSNSRTDSTVSPNSSMRTGRNASGEKISMIPLRSANCPGNSTISVCV